MNIWIHSRINFSMTYEEYKNKKNHKEPNENNFFKNLLSKFLTIVVFTLLVVIISNNNPSFKSFIIDKVLNSTFDFSKIVAVSAVIKFFKSLFKSYVFPKCIF